MPGRDKPGTPGTRLQKNHGGLHFLFTNFLFFPDVGGAQFARAWVGGARDCKRMEALTLALFLFACTLSPSRGAVANLVLLPDAVKEVSFVWALRYQAVERSNRSFSFNITRREPSAWMVPRLATTSGLVSGFIYC